MMNDHSQTFLPSVNAAAPQIVGYWLVNRELIVHFFRVGRRITSEQLWVCPHFRPFPSLLWANEAKSTNKLVENQDEGVPDRRRFFPSSLFCSPSVSVSRGVPRPSSRCQMSVIPGRRALSRWAACKPNPNTLSCSQPFQMAGGRRGELENHAASPCAPSRITISPPRLRPPRDGGCRAVDAMDRLSSLFGVMSPGWRGPEGLTDSPVCLCVTDGGGGAGGWQREGWRGRVLSRGATRGALMRGGDRMFLFFSAHSVSNCLPSSPLFLEGV